MGFDTPPAAVTPTTRTYLIAVQNAMSGLGITPPSNFTTPSKHTTVAMNAVNQALHRIWYAAQWDWRYRFLFFTMVDKQFLYDLPSDFIGSGTNMLRRYDRSPILFIDYKSLVLQFPSLAIPDATTLAAEGGTYETELETMLAADGSLAGLPTHYTIIGDRLGLFPVPWEDNVDATDWANSLRMVIGYYGAFKDLSATTDVLPIPTELYHAHHWLTQAYVKQTFEYPDAPMDEQRGERLLAQMVAKQRQKYNDDSSAAGRPTGW